MVSSAVLLSSWLMMIILVFVTASTSSHLSCPSPMTPTCNCLNTPEYYELQCSTFTVRVQPQAVICIQCTTNDISDFSVLNSLRIGDVDALIIRQCPLSSVSLNQLIENIGVSNVTSLTLHNNITQLPDDVFNDMPNLKHIDLKTNNVVLPKAVFCSVPKLLDLKLRSNNLTFLQPGVFYNLIKLRFLKLWGNLRNLSRVVFNDIQNLESLVINSSKMASLPSDLFVELINLRQMNLQENEFLSLPQNLFINNSKLETLNLLNNRRTLNTLPPRLLANLTKLKEVKVNSCNMSSVPEDLLWGSTSVDTISLRNNTLTTLPELLFKDCENLTILDISFNRITDLSNKLFFNTWQLKTMLLNDNQLTIIRGYLFSSLVKLEILDLKNNRLTNIEFEALSLWCPLRAMNMSNNMLTFEGASLSSLSKCVRLDDVQLSNNSLTTMFSLTRMFPDWRDMDLQTLNLSHNQISQLQVADFYIRPSERLYIDISYNNISKIDIFHDEMFNVVERQVKINLVRIYILVKGNPINCDCNYYTFYLYSLNLPAYTVYLLTIETEPDNVVCDEPEVRVGHWMNDVLLKPYTCLLGEEFSPICSEQCSCIFRYSDRALIIDCHQKNLTAMPEALPDLRINNDTELILSGNSIKSVKSPLGPGYYKVTKYNLSQNMISEFDLTASSSKLQDADFHLNGFLHTYVDVSYNNISEIDIFDEKTISKKTILDNNNVPVINFYIKGNPINCDCNVYSLLHYEGDKIIAEFNLTIETKAGNLLCDKLEAYTGQQAVNISLKHFTCLLKKSYSLNCPEQCSCILRHSDSALIVDCHQKNLTVMPEAVPGIHISNHTVIILSGNMIKSVKSPLGPGYYKVTKYILSDNMISEIDFTAFSSKLQVLKLDGNSIHQLNISSINFLLSVFYLTQLTLHNNPWKCDCSSKDLVTMITRASHLKKMRPLDNVKCVNGKTILNMSDTELCPVKLQYVIDVRYAVFSLVFGLLFGVLAFYYKFQNEIKVWLYAHRCCLLFISEEELDRDKVYDAFVCYCYNDEDFVADYLVPGLENGPIKYKVCVHYRDWIAGEFIPVQIANSVEQSRKIIVVLSPDFLQSVWGRMEFRAAHMQALSEKRNRVIVIMYRDIGPINNVDTELRTYLTMNTYIKWGDPLFWDKLRYALPLSLKLHDGIPLRELT